MSNHASFAFPPTGKADKAAAALACRTYDEANMESQREMAGKDRPPGDVLGDVRTPKLHLNTLIVGAT